MWFRDSHNHITGELQSVKWKDIRRAWSQDTVLRTPYIIMRNVAWGYNCRLRSGMGRVRGEKKRREEVRRPFGRSSRPLSSLCSLPFEFAKGKGREFRHETCPSSRAPRASMRPKSPFRSFRAPASQASFLAASPRFLPFTMEPGHRLLKMELLNEKYGHK